MTTSAGHSSDGNTRAFATAHEGRVRSVALLSRADAARSRLRSVLIGTCAAMLGITASGGAAMFVVTSPKDGTPGSLRAEIIMADADPGPSETIDFNLPGNGVHPVNVVFGQLPPLPHDTTIDGTSQPGYDGAPVVVLNGTALAPGTGDGLQLNGGGTIEGLDIQGFRAPDCASPAVATRSPATSSARIRPARARSAMPAAASWCRERAAASRSACPGPRAAT